MEFPEDFNQLELLNTHGDLIPRGASSLWTGSKDEDDEDDAEEAEHDEEWYLEKEERLKDRPTELILWAAENNRVSKVIPELGYFLSGLALICERIVNLAAKFQTDSGS